MYVGDYVTAVYFTDRILLVYHNICHNSFLQNFKLILRLLLYVYVVM